MRKKIFARQYFILFYVIIVVMPSICVGIWAYFDEQKNTSEIKRQSLEYVAKDVSADLRVYFNSFENPLMNISKDPVFQKTSPSPTEIMDQLAEFISYNLTAEYIYIGFDDGTFICYPEGIINIPTNYKLVTRPWYQLASTEGQVIWTPVYTSTDNKQMISVAAPIYKGESSNLIGVIATDFTLDHIAGVIESNPLMHEDIIMLIDREGMILYHSDKQYIGQQIETVMNQNGDRENNYCTLEGSLFDAYHGNKTLGYFLEVKALDLELYTYKHHDSLRVSQKELFQKVGVMSVISYFILTVIFILFYGINYKYFHLKQMHLALKKEAHYDSLTGVYNRKYILDRLEECQGIPIVLMMVDVDYFKRINDQYGHQAGDEVLSEIARTIQASLRHEDIVGRYGGEEFMVILPEVNLMTALPIAERIRKNIEKLTFSNDELTATISIGLAEWHEGYHTYQELVNEADKQLYRAKYNGRNQLQS